MNTDFQDQDLGEAWECPTCLQPFPPHHDYECGTCEMPASHHQRVTTLCKLMRETHTRELCLIAENNRLKTQLGDAKATADLWMKHAKHADEAAADLKAELEDTRRHWKEELDSVEARLMDQHAVFINMLHGKIAKLDWPKLEHINGPHPLRDQLAAERALADRLAEALKDIWPFIEEDIPHGCNSTGYMNAIELCRANITAWKEARSE